MYDDQKENNSPQGWFDTFTAKLSGPIKRLTATG